MPDRMSRHDEHDDRPELIKKRGRVILFDRLWRAFLTLLLLGIGTIMIYDVIIGHQTRSEILDCTVPGGECYQEGQKRTQDVLDDIGEIIRLTVSCADEVGTQSEAEIRECVLNRLGE